MAFRVDGKLYYPGMTQQQKVATTTGSSSTPTTTTGSSSAKQIISSGLSSGLTLRQISTQLKSPYQLPSTSPTKTTTKTITTTPSKTTSMPKPSYIKTMSPAQNLFLLKLKQQREEDKPVSKYKLKKLIAEDKSDTIEGIKKSPYLTKFGYKPKDKDYSIILGDISKSKAQLGISQTIVGGNLLIGMKNVGDIMRYTKQVKSAPSDQMFIVGGKTLTKSQTLTKLGEAYGGQLQSVKDQPSIGLIKSTGEKLIDTEKLVKAYQTQGYEVDITDKGEYEFKLPKASKVHSWWVGDPNVEKVALTSASFMESPLAIGTLIDAGASALTGDKSYTERRHEKLASYSLGLQESIKEGDYGGYIGKVATSPAMVQGVYLPAVSLGAGYALTGLTSGATHGGALVGKSAIDRGLIHAGARLGSKGVTGIKAGVGGAGVVMIGAGGVSIAQGISKGDIVWQDIPSMAGELAFTIGMAGGGFKTGKKIWHGKHKIGKIPATIGESKAIQKKILTESGAEQKVDFDILSKQRVGKQNVNVRAFGHGEVVGDMTTSTGRGWVKWTKKGRLGGEKGGWKRIDFDTSSKLETSMGDKALHKYYTETVSSGAEPMSGKGSILTEQLGKVDFGSKATLSKHWSVSSGDIMGNFMKGRNLQFTDMIQMSPKQPAGVGSAGGFNIGDFRISSGKGGSTLLKLTHDSGGRLKLISSSVTETLGKLASESQIQPPSMSLGMSGGTLSIGAGTLSAIKLKSDTKAGSQPAKESTISFQKTKPLSMDIKLAPSVIGLGTGKSLSSILKTDKKTGYGTGKKPSIGIQKPVLDIVTDTKPGRRIGLVLKPMRGTGEMELGKSKGGLMLGLMGKGEVVGTGREEEIGLMGKVSPVITPVFDLGLETGEEYEPVIGTVSAVGSAQMQAQKQKMGLLAVSIGKTVPPITVTPISIPGVVIPPPFFGGGGRGEYLTGRKKFWDFGLGKKGKRTLVKTVLADPFMVQHSMIKFGKATHMTPTKELWTLGEKTHWRLPTLELLKKGKNNNSQISLNVLRR